MYDEPEYDAELGMPGLHTVRQKVAHQKRESCIPPDLINRYSSLNFWLKPDMNARRDNPLDLALQIGIATFRFLLTGAAFRWRPAGKSSANQR